jgi:hypothetical protein
MSKREFGRARIVGSNLRKGSKNGSSEDTVMINVEK